MNASVISSALLLDHLNRTLKNPAASQLWHALLELYKAEANKDVRAMVRDTIHSNAPRLGVAGFLRTTFLFEITNDLAYLMEAGEVLLNLDPFDPDRVMAFAVYMWGAFITKSDDRHSFARILRMTRIPELVARLGSQVADQAKNIFPPRPVTSIRKVAMVASYIGDDQHTPTPLTLNYARMLCQLGYEVRLFSPQELRVPDMPIHFGNNQRLITVSPNHATLGKSVPSGVVVTLSDERFSLASRWSDATAAIANFDPDLVMFVGLNSPLTAAMHQARPVLGLCVHAMQPMAPVDVWLTADPAQAIRADSAWAPSIPPALGHYHPFRIKLKPRSADLDRAALGLRDSAIVLLSMGARLPQEIKGDWAARMSDLLRRHGNVQWLLLGGSATRPGALNGIPENQVLTLGHSDHVRSVMAQADIYINPPRVGGGFSVAEAMAEGLPILALKDSDGGDKIGNSAMQDFDSYFAELEALIADSTLRQQRGATMHTRFEQTLNLDNSADSLRAACELSLARYRYRMS